MAAAAAATVRTGFTDAFGLLAPLFAAPMDGVSGGALAAAVARAGGLGSIACGAAADPAWVAAEVGAFRAAAPAGAALCLGFLGDKCVQHAGDHAPILDAIAAHRPEAVQLFVPSDALVAAVRAAAPEPLVLASVATVADARRLLRPEGANVRVDGLIATGREGGGHSCAAAAGSGTLPLARRVVELAELAGEAAGPRRPFVLAAGGIVDGPGAAAALALGCDGAVLGTRLFATHQALNPKKALLPAADAVVKTDVYDVLANKVAAAKGQPVWRPPFDHAGVVKTPTVEEFHARGPELAAFVAGLSVAECEAALADLVLAGEGVGSIASLRDAEEVVAEIRAATVAAIRRSHALLAPVPGGQEAWGGRVDLAFHARARQAAGHPGRPPPAEPGPGPAEAGGAAAAVELQEVR